MTSNNKKTSTNTDKLSVNLCNLTTFHTTAFAKQLIIIDRLSVLDDLPHRLENQDFIVLGSGSNVLFADDYQGIVVVNRLHGINIVQEDNQHALIEVAAGENWHNLVVNLNQKGLYGLENLALIPGTMGAAPVQNIGAYGVEVANFIHSVTVFDITTKDFKTFTTDECGFAYRNSYFKQTDWRKQYIITSVTLRLSKTFTPVLSYQGLCQPDTPKTATELLNRVITVRQSKLPDPEILPNAGSFFKNPVISRHQLKQLQETYTDIPYFEIDTDSVKVPAAWLIEQSGFKGYKLENGAGVYEKHALILVNYGQAHGRDIYRLAIDIMKEVKNKFTIDISPEVRIMVS
ncbi:MAG: UDP-N-acetylmuramate dehydrogenase [Gammaproteobacteria bacterium]|nr:UDP-N-acetylmuramate dehydrogenase [Gammaproteobacteria bacterium]